MMHWIALRPLPEKTRPADMPNALVALGWWALRFTPKVARLEDAVLLEVSASARLWGGQIAMLRQILATNEAVAPVQYAQGATSLIAFARLQQTRLAHTAADDLPLAALAAARSHLATLARIGCRHWGQLRALPRAGVARRFGAPLLDALDRAYGLAPELYPWLVLPEVFAASLELAAQVETAPALLFGARRLLGQLQLWLQLRQRGVRALVLRWSMDPRRDTARAGELLLRCADATANMAHLQRLLGEQLAQVRLPSPVQSLHLRTLQTQALSAETASLLSDGQRPGEALQCLLERLSARLGSQNVLQFEACGDYRPERMQRWMPATSAAQLIAPCAIDTSLAAVKEIFPSWLLSAPLRLGPGDEPGRHPGSLTLLSGPQRLEAGWWETGHCALRDYYLARSEQLGLLWIYRERLSALDRSGGEAGGPTAAAGVWYLHGLFA